MIQMRNAPALMLAAVSCAMLGCGGSREPVVVEEIVDPGPTAAELAITHQQMREQAEATVAGKAGAQRFDYADGKRARTLDLGIAEEASFKDGQLDGPYTRSYKGGQKELETSYTAGLKDGSWKSWYENGQLFEDGAFRAGKRHGIWTSYYENGQVMEKAEYDNGYLVQTYGAFLADGTEIALEAAPRNP